MKIGLSAGITISALLAVSWASEAGSAQGRTFEEVMTVPVPGGNLLGDGEATGPSAPPSKAFRGCAPPKSSEADIGGTAAYAQASQQAMTDPVTARRFAAIPIDPNESVSAQDFANDCRLRLDGIWIQDARIKFDRKKTSNVFSGVPGRGFKSELTHGNFTTPVLMHITTGLDANILVMRAIDSSSSVAPMKFQSTDGITIQQLLRPGGPVKTYRQTNGNTLELQASTDRFGRVRIRTALDQIGINYVRPTPTVSEVPDTSSVDPWTVGLNLDNLAANRTGYDIVTMNMFNLMLDRKSEVFAPADPQQYYISEKRTVPLGLKLYPENYQGTITSSTLATSQEEYQEQVSTSVGVNLGFKTLGDDGKATDIASASVGVNYTNERTTGVEIGRANNLAIGYARHKLYSLILDRPFAKLSKDFIVAIDDARQYGRYDELIRKFGTHYPYAVTYGSSARMETGFTRETIAEWEADGENIGGNGGVSILGFGVSSQGNTYTQNTSANRQFNEAGYKDFDAIGGTGSFGEGGYQTGVPTPILADLRPLYQLLNRVNFPGEPEIYETAREQLKTATEAYLLKHANKISAVRNVPRDQTWRITPRWLRCLSSGDQLKPFSTPFTIQLRGTIRLKSMEHPQRRGPSRIVYPFRAVGNDYKEFGCANTQSGSKNTFAAREGQYLEVTGTPAELRKYVFRFRAQLTEVDFGLLDKNDSFNMNSAEIRLDPKANSKVGDYYTRVFEIWPQQVYYRPKILVNYRMERVR